MNPATPATRLDDAPRSLTLLGATGTIGDNTLDIMKAHRERFSLVALTAGGNVQKLIAQARELRPQMAVIADESGYAALKEGLAGTGITAAAGAKAVVDAAALPSDIVMSAIVGAAGLKPTLAAISRGAQVGLANKECLVCAGELMLREVARGGATLVPVDSEHSAIFQVYDPAHKGAVVAATLTASGGPFREFTLEQMRGVTPQQAIKHPNWNMGAKISVDSATLMNKGLELIEAHYLFGFAPDKLSAIIHPQSIVHCLVEMHDGSVLAQMSLPDMRTPIAYALGWPERISAPLKRLDLAGLRELSFFAPDEARFPALRLAKDAMRAGGSAPTVLNAANEVAVGRFLKGEIGFLDIAAKVEKALTAMPASALSSIDDVLACDAQARELTERL